MFAVTMTQESTPRTGRWSEVRDEESLAVALSVCRGHYQEALVLGDRPVSGSDIKDYRRYYQRSAANLIRRINDAGVSAEIVVRERGRKVLRIGY